MTQTKKNGSGKPKKIAAKKLSTLSKKTNGKVLKVNKTSKIKVLHVAGSSIGCEHTNAISLIYGCKSFFNAPRDEFQHVFALVNQKGGKGG